MKRLINYLVLLPLLVITTGSAMAQSTSPTPNNNNAIAVTNSDANHVAIFEAYPNPTKGMITIKTECVGKVSFYSQKGKEKGNCLVNEGTNIIYLQNVLIPGVYICRFEGVNGSVAEVRVVYEL